MKRTDKTPRKKTFGFRKPEFADYMDDLLEGRSWLIINPVNSKSSSYDSLTDDTTYTLTFNVTHPRVDLSKSSGYRRYNCDCDLFTYQKAAEGDDAISFCGLAEMSGPASPEAPRTSLPSLHRC